MAFFVHPTLVLIAAFLFIAIWGVAVPLFAPAVWSGLSFKESVASLIAIAQQRLVQVVMMLIVLYLIVTVIVGVLALSFIPASSVLTSLASIIIPSYSIDGMGALMNPMANGMSGGAMGGAMMGLVVLLISLASSITPNYSIDGMGALMNPMAIEMSGGAMGGAMMGLAVLLVGLSALLMQVWVLGLNVVYLQAADGVVCADVGTSEFCDG